LVIARQRHSKHISAETDTDITIEDVVFPMWPLIGNNAVNMFPQSQSTHNKRNCWKQCFLYSLHKGYITRISSRL
jgi:hypothetical protein